MTVNELIFNFRINVENGGVFIIEKSGSFLKVTKAMLDKIGEEEIKGHTEFDGKVFVHISRNIKELTICEVK